MPLRAEQLLDNLSSGPAGLVHPLTYSHATTARYAAGLFDGPAGSALENDGDGRARIPPYTAGIVAPEGTTSLGQALGLSYHANLSPTTQNDPFLA